MFAGSTAARRFSGSASGMGGGTSTACRAKAAPARSSRASTPTCIDVVGRRRAPGLRSTSWPRRTTRPSATSIARGSMAAARPSGSRRPSAAGHARLHARARRPARVPHLLALRSAAARSTSCRLPDHRSLRPLTDTAKLDGGARAGAPAAGRVSSRSTSATGSTLDGWMLKPSDFDAAKRYPVIVLRLRRAGRHDRHRPAGAAAGCSSIARSPRPATWSSASTTAARRRRKARVAEGRLRRRRRPVVARNRRRPFARWPAARPYIDRDRIGIWGWSGGGSNTLNCMFRFPDVFKVGVVGRARCPTSGSTTRSTRSATWACRRTTPRATGSARRSLRRRAQGRAC